MLKKSSCFYLISIVKGNYFEHYQICGNNDLLTGINRFPCTYCLVFYNSLIRKKNDVENAFASIDVMLKRRHDLIPAPVDTVKGYVNYERDLLTEITELRVLFSGRRNNQGCDSPISGKDSPVFSWH
ncbi:MAG TPA: LemA family protein [Bacteroidales bacterium]|jgi:hypothetical protein|nr:LemA family protein [Bacteroidales bacterium]HOS72599.1 LemA family protein [Bacteroidales bacterium]HQH25680.1 LemA family protein [Bacteroidales bacterium]HQK71173.1 LemA family protein [Bacteroidales bacterium]